LQKREEKANNSRELMIHEWSLSWVAGQLNHGSRVENVTYCQLWSKARELESG